MIKLNFKTILYFFVFLAFFPLLTLVSLASPENVENENLKIEQQKESRRPERASDVKNRMKNEFCEKIFGIKENFSKKADEKKQKTKERNQERFENLENRQNERDAKINRHREMRENNLDEHIKKLDEKAETEEQKRAIEEFKNSVQSAMEKRRMAIDEAIRIFRTEVKKIIVSNRAEIEKSIQSFQDLQEGAFSKAKKECEKDSDFQKIRTYLMEEIKIAKNKFKINRQETEKVGEKIEALAKIKNESIQKAQNDFRISLEKAVFELKKEFPKE